MKIEKGKKLDVIIRDFELEIVTQEAEIALMQEKIKFQKVFLSDIKKRVQPKMSELYEALETDSSKFYRIKEFTVESRPGSWLEIRVFKKYFFDTNQIKIIQEFFMKKHCKTIHDIRIMQFY